MSESKSDEHRPEKHFNIQIDREHYKVAQQKLTGADLRKLPNPDIPDDRDLYLVVPGADDNLVEQGEAIKMRDGLRFFTVPGHINPGSAD